MPVFYEETSNRIAIACNLSGALEAVKNKRFVVLVDVIDMSTTVEALLEAGAAACWGAAPAGQGLPYANPFRIGLAAAQQAVEKALAIAVVCEPRVGSDEERMKRADSVLAGIKSAGLPLPEVYPNLGAETAKFCCWQNRLAVVVSGAGGLIYDAVWQAGGRIATATVARTMLKKGKLPAQAGVRRVLEMAKGMPITVVAASSNALEDVLAAHFLASMMAVSGDTRSC